MSNKSYGLQNTQRLVMGAILTALVIVLQLLGSFVRFGPFSISLVLIPIVLGAATCGYKIGSWLGFVFGLAVLLSGDAAFFYGISPIGTLITVILKGILCGLLAGLVFKALENRNKYLAIMLSAIVCPIVNTGIFLVGCSLFFLDAVTAMGAEQGFNSVAGYMFLGLAGGNFLFELITNIILAPVVLRILNIKR